MNTYLVECLEKGLAVLVEKEETEPCCSHLSGASVRISGGREKFQRKSKKRHSKFLPLKYVHAAFLNYTKAAAFLNYTKAAERHNKECN